MQALYGGANASIKQMIAKLLATLAYSGAGEERKKKWEMYRPKDVEPSLFSGKEDEWAKWKEEIEDYADAVHPGIKDALVWASKLRERVTEESLRKQGVVDEDWTVRGVIFRLLEIKTGALSEARKVMRVPMFNGHEACRAVT